ncbi:MAG: lipid-A-disaccharide synthase [Henriciella sp.]|nr:lipid-A-disaccharide synthase [Henriciella sp.]
MRPARLFIVAAEPSGDVLARETVEAYRSFAPDTEFAAIGGQELAAIRLPSPIDTSPLAILGIFDGLKIYGEILRLADQATDEIIAFNPDAVILVDSWGFMIRVAERLQKRAPNIKVIKLVGPQIWATRPGRAKKIAAVVDHVICIHEMEVPYYEPLGVPTTVMGNPALSRTEKGDGAQYRAALGLSDEEDLLLVLPGSRPSEIARVAPVLVEAAQQIERAKPNVRLVFAPAPAIREQFLERFPELAERGQVAEQGAERFDVMAAADLALACSGTVTSELALQGTPFIVGYKAGWMTWAVARFFLYKPNHITLLNIAADDTEVAKEFLQTKFKPGLIADAALALLNDRAALQAQRAAQDTALARMVKPGMPAAEIAARAIRESIAVPE